MRKKLHEVVRKKIYVIEHRQYGYGMTIQLLPALLELKRQEIEFYIKVLPTHVPVLAPWFDKKYIVPYKAKPAFKGFWITDPLSGSVEPPPNIWPLDSNFPDGDGPYAAHAVDYYFRRFHTDFHHIEIPIELKNYPRYPVENIDTSKFNLPENYVAISPTTTKESCIIRRDEQLKINKYIKELGYNIVYIGSSWKQSLNNEHTTQKAGDIDISRKITIEEQDFSDGLNLTNQTTIEEAIAIMAKSKLYIGPEGGLMHCAGMTDVPMIIPFASMSPATRAPIRNNKLGYNVYPVIPDVECRFCIARLTHRQTDKNVMKECLFDDFKCLDEITFEKFKVQIDKIL